jgi:hypothetical protein
MSQGCVKMSKGLYRYIVYVPKNHEKYIQNVYTARDVGQWRVDKDINLNTSTTQLAQYLITLKI